MAEMQVVITDFSWILIGCQLTRYTVNSSEPKIVWRDDCFVEQICDELTAPCECDDDLFVLAVGTDNDGNALVSVFWTSVTYKNLHLPN